jgi:hypothetical protein
MFLSKGIKRNSNLINYGTGNKIFLGDNKTKVIKPYAKSSIEEMKGKNLILA